MILDTNSIKVDGVSLAPYLVEAEFGYHKIWSSDSGRNMVGSMTGSLVGIFPKIICQFRALNKTELQTLAPLLDKATQNVTYYDVNKKTNRTMSTYTGDWTYKNRIMNKADGFSVSFISRKRR